MKPSDGRSMEKGCRDLFFCMIEDCPNCEILLDLENVKFDERAKERSERKPPPETWKEAKKGETGFEKGKQADEGCENTGKA
jgi:hypothetical protein